MDALISVILTLIGLGIYLFPFIVANIRNHHNVGAIFILNLFLGWTFLGWIGALIWAFIRPPENQIIVIDRKPLLPTADMSESPPNQPKKRHIIFRE